MKVPEPLASELALFLAQIAVRQLKDDPEVAAELYSEGTVLEWLIDVAQEAISELQISKSALKKPLRGLLPVAKGIARTEAQKAFPEAFASGELK